MEAEANRWAARRCVGPLGDPEATRLQHWLAADERHAGALLRAEAGLALIARAHVLQPAEDTPAVSRRGLIGWGTAAVVAAGAAGFWLLPRGDAVATGVGEIRRTRLADASTVTLNTQSRVTVDLQPAERNISLDRGEAWFQVAHDRSRPFVVSAADVRVRAVGTAFSVRRMAGGADVLVTEGRVEVWRADRPDQRVAVSHGRRAFVPDDGVAIVPVSAGAAIDRKLAWRAGRLALAGETLDYAISEMNRYNHVQVKVDDPELGAKPIIGVFRVDDPLGFARSVAALEGARVDTASGLVRIIPERS